MKTHIIFGLSVVVLIIAFMVGSSYYKGKQAEKIGFLAQENAELFVRDHSQTLGSDDAKVYLIEFMDPACETCAAFSSFVKQMIVTNPGKIKLVVRYAPFHEGADYFVSKNVSELFANDSYIDTIILGCTHYPLLADKIRKYIPADITLVEQGDIVGESLKDYLYRHPEMDMKCSKNGTVKFYTTEQVSKFKNTAGIFFNGELNVEHLVL